MDGFGIHDVERAAETQSKAHRLATLKKRSAVWGGFAHALPESCARRAIKQ
jgi:hypothetical protein